MSDIMGRLKRQMEIAREALATIAHSTTNKTNVAILAISAIDKEYTNTPDVPVKVYDVPLDWPDAELRINFEGGEVLGECVDFCMELSKRIDHTVFFEFNGKDIEVHHWSKKQDILNQYTKVKD